MFDFEKEKLFTRNFPALYQDAARGHLARFFSCLPLSGKQGNPATVLNGRGPRTGICFSRYLSEFTLTNTYYNS